MAKVGRSASSHSTSAGVNAPPRRWITSPGTNLETGRDSVKPSRRPWWKVAEAEGKLYWKLSLDENWSGKLMKTAGVGQVKKGSKGLRHVQNRSPIATALPIAPTSTSFPPSTSPQSMTSILQIKRGQKITHETPFKTASKLICCDLFGISSYQLLSVIYIYT